MNWERERDGILVVGIVAVVLAALLRTDLGAGGFLTTFVATFLGVLVALRTDAWVRADGRTEPNDESTARGVAPPTGPDRRGDDPAGDRPDERSTGPD